MIILEQFSPVLHKNIHCGYTSESPLSGASDEYPQCIFSWRNEKNIRNYCQIRLLNKSSVTHSGNLILCLLLVMKKIIVNISVHVWKTYSLQPSFSINTYIFIWVDPLDKMS